MENIKQSVSEYYGQTIQKTEDLVFDACCTSDYDPTLLKKLSQEILDKRYGCGSPIPELLSGCTVLDLGCGAGADCYIASQLVGESGRVIGVDMTDEQLEVANRNVAFHMKQFGFSSTNIEFRKGFIENIPAEDHSVDVVISNCVINLSDDKQAVLNEIWRVLKPGGEFYIADIVADRRVPETLQQDGVLWSECLTGALYQEDLRRMFAQAGFLDTRVVRSRKLKEKIQGVGFLSDVLRGFKLPLEDRCEDYGQVAIYKGTIAGKEDSFLLDDHHFFSAGQSMRVCKNTAEMLSKSRYAAHFYVSEPLVHLGLFDCLSSDKNEPMETSSQQGSSCC